MGVIWYPLANVQTKKTKQTQKNEHNIEINSIHPLLPFFEKCFANRKRRTNQTGIDIIKNSAIEKGKSELNVAKKALIGLEKAFIKIENFSKAIHNKYIIALKIVSAKIIIHPFGIYSLIFRYKFLIFKIVPY